MASVGEVIQRVFNSSNNTFDVSQKGSSVLNHGSQDVATAGTSEQLPDQTCKEVTIIAKENNTGNIYIGGSTVSSTSYGAKLSTLDSITLSISNTNLIYIDSDNNGEGVTYIAI